MKMLSCALDRVLTGHIKLCGIIPGIREGSWHNNRLRWCKDIYTAGAGSIIVSLFVER